MPFQKGHPKPKNAYSFPKGHKGYNFRPNSGSFKKGEKKLPFSDKHRKHMGDVRRGKPSVLRGRKLSEEHKQKVKENHSHYWLGKKQTKEHIEARIKSLCLFIN